MSQLERLYTMDEVSRMTNLPLRVIQNHLRTGTLRGRRLGGQWRFTSTDIQEMMDNIIPESETATEQKKAVSDFMDGTNAERKEKNQVCTIADLYISREVADKKDSQLRTLLDVTDKDVETYYTYDYDEKEERARFVFFAPPQLVSKMMRIIK